MKHFKSPKTLVLLASLAVLSSTFELRAADLVNAKDGSGIYGYKDTPKLPWCDFLVHDADRPAPKRITPKPTIDLKSPSTAPSDAIVLFDGKNLDQWQSSEWKMENDQIVAGNGDFKSKQSFGNAQIHLEWMAPTNSAPEWYNRGNNGVYLMGLYEIQIFDSYNEKIYPDGQAAAVYGQTPPMVNACVKPGEWQSYDIFFAAPVFEGEKLIQPAKITMMHNDVLVHLNQDIKGETGHRILPEYRQKVSTGPLMLSGHNCPVRFRNIWIRSL